MRASGTTNKSEWEQVNKIDFKFKNETTGQSGSWRIYSVLYGVYN